MEELACVGLVKLDWSFFRPECMCIGMGLF